MEQEKPKIMLWDIETSPIISYNWGVYESDAIEIVEDWQILSVAWKWLGEKKIFVVGQDDFESWKPGVNDDTHVVETIRELLDECDIAIGHNSKQFDERKANARMIIRGIAPPSPYKTIDTKMVAKRYAFFTRNNLKHLANDFQSKHRKSDPGGFSTWKGCLAGDKKAWKRLKTYNKHDIDTLEDVYMQLRPWISNHPSLARISNEPMACPKCNTPNRMQRRGWSVTNVGRYRRYQCQACSGWSKDRVALNLKEDVRPAFASI